jgi:hypothetical protein
MPRTSARNVCASCAGSSDQLIIGGCQPAGASAASTAAAIFGRLPGAAL